jgi:DnaD/phage-associated family protein
MSNKMLKLVWDADLELRDKERLVLLALADWANDAGKCWPGIVRIAARTHQSERNVRYVLKALEAKQVLTVQNGGGRHVTNVYRIDLERLQGNANAPPQGGEVAQPEVRERVQDTLQPPQETGQTGDENLQATGGNGARAVAPEPSLEPLKNPSTAAAARPELFSLYENNIGLLTPMMVDELKCAEQEYPAAWFADAFAEAVRANVRRWNYVRAILERWRTRGRDDDRGHQHDRDNGRARPGESAPGSAGAAKPAGLVWYERERARMAREAEELSQRPPARRVSVPGEPRGG